MLKASWDTPKLNRALEGLVPGLVRAICSLRDTPRLSLSGTGDWDWMMSRLEWVGGEEGVKEIKELVRMFIGAEAEAFWSWTRARERERVSFPHDWPSGGRQT